MTRLTTMGECNFIGLCLQGFFFGLYSGVFAMYMQYRATTKETNSNTRNVIFYCICVLYVLSIALFASDISTPIFRYLDRNTIRIAVIQATLFACCDLIAQFILIYRCWIVWGRNIRVVIVPSILAMAFLATWVATSSSEYFLSHQLVYSGWLLPVFLSSLTLSLTVNALVTGLIVLRIFNVFRQVKTASDDQILVTTGGRKLRRIIFIIIESGMALFSIQLARLVATILPSDAASSAFQIFVGIHEMLNGITPTIILVRISMGLSFHDEKSMEEVAIGSLHFASNHLNSVSEMESIGIVDQDSRNDDEIGIQQSNESEVVER